MGFGKLFRFCVVVVCKFSTKLKHFLKMIVMKRFFLKNWWEFFFIQLHVSMSESETFSGLSVWVSVIGIDQIQITVGRSDSLLWMNIIWECCLTFSLRFLILKERYDRLLSKLLSFLIIKQKQIIAENSRPVNLKEMFGQKFSEDPEFFFNVLKNVTKFSFSICLSAVWFSKLYIELVYLIRV